MEVDQAQLAKSHTPCHAVAEDVHTDPNHRGLSGYALEKYYDEKKP